MPIPIGTAEYITKAKRVEGVPDLAAVPRAEQRRHERERPADQEGGAAGRDPADLVPLVGAGAASADHERGHGQDHADRQQEQRRPSRSAPATRGRRSRPSAGTTRARRRSPSSPGARPTATAGVRSVPFGSRNSRCVPISPNGTSQKLSMNGRVGTALGGRTPRLQIAPDHQHLPARGVRRHPERHDQADDAERGRRRQQHQLAPRLPGSVRAVEQPHRDLDDPDERDHDGQGEDAPRQAPAVRRGAPMPPAYAARYPGSTCGFEGERLRAGPGASTTYRGRWIPSGSTFDQSMPAHGS